MTKHLLFFLVLALSSYFPAFAGKSLSNHINRPNIGNDSLITVTGRVLDSLSEKAIPYLNVSIFNRTDKQRITDILLGEKGDFLFSCDHKLENIELRISFQGNLVTKSVLLDSNSHKGSEYSLGNIYIHILSANELREVVIKEKSNNWYSHIQRRTFPVTRLRTAEAQIISSYLKFLPGITTIGGDVVIDGRKKPVYYLNGTASTKTIIENLPLQMVEKVEIISNPPLSQNIGAEQAIINVVTKKTQTLFLAGSIRASTSAILRNVGESASVYVFKKDLLLSISSNTYTNRYHGTKRSDWSIGGADPFFTQKGETKTSLVPGFHNISIQNKFGRNIDLSTSFHYNTMLIKQNGTQTIFKGVPLTSQSNWSRIKIKRKSEDYSATVKAKYNLGQPGSIYFNGFYTRSGKTNLTTTLDSQDQVSFATENDMGVTDKGMQLTYEVQKGNVFIELGSLFNRHDSNSLIKSNFQDQNTSSVGNAVYSEELLSLFATTSLQIKEGAQLLIGSKLQHSTITNFFENETKRNNTKWRIYPQVSFSKVTDKSGTFLFSYQRDISLPGPSLINPTNQLKGVNTYVRGSNALVPEFSNSFEVYHIIEVGKEMPVSLTNSIFYRQIRNLLGTGGYAVNTKTYNLESIYSNIGDSKIAGIDLQAKKQYKKLSFGLNGKMEFNYYDVPDTKMRSGFAYKIEYQSSYSFNDNLSCNLELSYRNRSLSTYEYGTIGLPTSSVSLDGSLLKNKLFFSIYFTTMFNMSNKKNYLYESTYVRGISVENTRTQDLELSLRYSFGKSSQVSKFRGKFKSYDGRKTKE